MANIKIDDKIAMLSGIKGMHDENFIKGMSDEKLFGLWDIEAKKWIVPPVLKYGYSPGLNPVRECAQRGDYEQAKTELLGYYKKRAHIPAPDILANKARGRLIVEASTKDIYQYSQQESSIAEITVDGEWGWRCVDLENHLCPVYGLMDWQRDGCACIRSKEHEGFEPRLEITTAKTSRTLKPEGDTYIRAGAYGGENFGAERNLFVQESGTPIDSDTMRPYFYFIIPELESEVKSVRLHFYAKSIKTAKVSLLVLAQHQMGNLNEHELTWNTHTPQTFSYKNLDGEPSQLPRYRERRWLMKEFDWSYPPGAEFEWLMSESRLGCVKNLAAEYLATGEERYAGAAIFTLLNFYARRPACYPRNLELAGRVHNCVPAFFALLDSRHMKPETAATFIKCLYEHAVGLSTDKKAENNFAICIQSAWQTFNTYFPEFEEEGWWHINSNKLIGVFNRSILPDGSYIESCTGYIAGVLGQIRECLRKGEIKGEPLPGLLNSYHKLVRYYMDLAMPDGKTVRWGDGGLSPIQDRIKNEGDFLHDPEMQFFGSGGKEGVRPQHDSSFYFYGRTVTMRTDWIDKNGLAAFINARVGGNHAHPDALHLDIYAYGRALLLDPGSGNYNPDDPVSEWQRHTTIAHNTIEINGKAQKTGSARDFESHSNMSFLSNRIFSHVEAWHEGYPGFRHERRVLFVRPTHWIVSDRISAPDGIHDYRQAWHPDLKNNFRIDNKTKMATTCFSSGANVMVIPADPGELRAEIASGYMQNLPEKYLVYAKEGVRGDTTFDTLIYPVPEHVKKDVYTRRTAVLQAGRKLESTEATAVELIIGEEQKGYYCHRYKESGAEIGFAGYLFDGEMAYCEEDAGGDMTYIALKNGSRLLRSTGFGSTTSERLSLVQSSETLSSLGLQWHRGALHIEYGGGKLDLRVYSSPGVNRVVLNGIESAFSHGGQYINVAV